MWPERTKKGVYKPISITTEITVAVPDYLQHELQMKGVIVPLFIQYNTIYMLSIHHFRHVLLFN